MFLAARWQTRTPKRTRLTSALALTGSGCRTSAPGADPAAMYRLYVDVGCKLPESQIWQHFMKYGPVLHVRLPKHSPYRNKGYAFVTLSSEQAVSKALLDPQPVVQGVRLKVSTVRHA